MSKCEHGLTSRECFVCASPKKAAPPAREPTADALVERLRKECYCDPSLQFRCDQCAAAERIAALTAQLAFMRDKRVALGKINGELHELAERAESALAAANEREEGLRRALALLCTLHLEQPDSDMASYHDWRLRWNAAWTAARAALARKEGDE